MKQKELDNIIKKLMHLKEQPFNEIIRTGAMLSLGFGEKIKTQSAYKTNEGVFGVKETQKSKYAVHIDCLFRISYNDKILLTKEDMFRPSTMMDDNNFNEESFNWDMKGNNKFDAEITNIFDLSRQTPLVKSINVTSFGDLCIALSNGYAIEVLIDTNEEEECWRIFEVGNIKAPHVVITGCGYYEE